MSFEDGGFVSSSLKPNPKVNNFFSPMLFILFFSLLMEQRLGMEGRNVLNLFLDQLAGIIFFPFFKIDG